MLRTAVLVSGGGTNLQALIDAEKAGKLGLAKIVKVISSRADAYALERAKQAGIETAVVERGSFDNSHKYDEAIGEELDKCGAQLIVLAGFMSILGPGLINRFERKIINVHPALIPSFCGKGFYGLNVHRAVLKKGVKVTGATVHFVNEIPDGGDIIFQKAVNVLDGDTPQALQRRVMEQAEWVLLPQAVEAISFGKVK